MISRIFRGYTITVDNVPHLVVGSRQVRGTYWYTVRKPDGIFISLRRSDVLEGQTSGRVQVTL